MMLLHTQIPLVPDCSLPCNMLMSILFPPRTVTLDVVSRWMDGWMDGWMEDGQIEREIESYK